MLLHIDGSQHRWFCDERWYDLLVVMDDATSEIYYAQLVAEESFMDAIMAIGVSVANAILLVTFAKQADAKVSMRIKHSTNFTIQA